MYVDNHIVSIIEDLLIAYGIELDDVEPNWWTEGEKQQIRRVRGHISHKRLKQATKEEKR